MKHPVKLDQEAAIQRLRRVCYLDFRVDQDAPINKVDNFVINFNSRAVQTQKHDQEQEGVLKFADTATKTSSAKQAFSQVT